MTQHTVRFFRATDTGGYCVRCSCGWSRNDSELPNLQEAAAVHDLDELELETPQLQQPGFVSGLP